MDLGSQFQPARPAQQMEMSVGERGIQHLWKWHCQLNDFCVFSEKFGLLGLCVPITFSHIY